MPINNDNSTLNSSSPIPSTIDADTKAPVIPSALSPAAQLKLEVIVSLLAATDKQSHAAMLKEAAARLKKSERTIERMTKPMARFELATN